MKLTLTYKEQVERTREIELPYYAKRDWAVGTDYYAITFEDGSGTKISAYSRAENIDAVLNCKYSDVPAEAIEITAEEFTQGMDAAIAKLYAKFQQPAIR